MKSTTTTAPATAEPWITVEAAAAHLGVSRGTVRRWIKEGKLNARRIPGGLFRLRISDLDAVLDPVATSGKGPSA